MIDKTEEEIIQKWKGDIHIPLVSISCATYNHEKYIAAALDGFLMQETDFPFEIIIGEDSSTDQTLEIISEYKEKYPNIIKLIAWPENVGASKNWTTILQTCQGKYIANCEGDDFWISHNKLQKQIHFMENNPDFAICCHQCVNFDQTNQIIVGNYPDYPDGKELSISDLFVANIANTCSIVYRNYHFKLPDFFETLKVGDWPMHMLHAQYGKIKYFHDTMALYRIHQNGVWSSTADISKIDESVLMLRSMNNYFNNIFEEAIHSSIRNYLLRKAFLYLDIQEYNKADASYKEAASYSSISFFNTVKYLFKKHLPILYAISIFIKKRINKP